MRMVDIEIKKTVAGFYELLGRDNFNKVYFFTEDLIPGPGWVSRDRLLLPTAYLYKDAEKIRKFHLIENKKYIIRKMGSGYTIINSEDETYFNDINNFDSFDYRLFTYYKDAVSTVLDLLESEDEDIVYIAMNKASYELALGLVYISTEEKKYEIKKLFQQITDQNENVSSFYIDAAFLQKGES